MKNLFKVFGIIALVAIIGFSMAACDNSGGDGDVYKLEWAVLNLSRYEVESTIQQQGWNVETADNGNSAMAKGNVAETIKNYGDQKLQSKISDNGELTGSFDELVNFSKDGISAPPGLKALCLNNKANVPLVGIFDGGNAGAVFFYIEYIGIEYIDNPGPSGSFTVNDTTGRLTMNGFPSSYNGKYVLCSWYNNNTNEGLKAYENINRNSASSITITYGTITNGSVTLKVWKVIQDDVYNNFTESGSYSIYLCMPLDKTLNQKLGDADAYPVTATIDVEFINGQGTVDVSSYLDAINIERTFGYFETADAVTITGGPGGSVTIPAKIKGKPVTSIGERAFEYCESLTSVTIPDSVTSIGDYAFYHCTSLTSVTIPNSVTSIGNYAFYVCESLTSVTIGNSVTSIGEGAFQGTGLTSITIPNSVTTIGDGAFEGCTSLTSITIQNSVIGNGMFAGCSSLTSITIPNSVTTIGEQAFYYCYSLTSVTFETGSDIAEDNFGSSAFPGYGNYGDDELKTAYSTGKAGTYTWEAGGYTWTKQ